MIDQPHDTTTVAENPRLSIGWPILWLVSGLVWALAIGLLVAIPADPKNNQVFGLSINRILLVGTAFLLLVAHLGMAWTAYYRPIFRQRALDPIIVNSRSFLIVLGLLTGFFFGLWASLLITDGFQRPSRLFLPYSAYIIRLLPFGFCLLLEMVIFIFGLLVLRFGFHLHEFRQEKPLWLNTAGIMGAFLVLGLLMAVTGLGITPDRVGWGKPGVPLLFYQVLLIWLAGLILAIVVVIVQRKVPNKRGILVDACICLLLWIAAVWSWSDLDVQRSYFAPSPAPPNNEIYPYSDAGYYDYQAQSLLMGYGFVNGQVVPRPLYILFLAGFHAIAGQDYEKTIFIQTLFLAFLPVFLYLLGKTIHSRPLGISIGILAILRESNSILATPWVEVSHSKLLLADLPTTVAIIALTWLCVRWFTNPKQNWSDALLVGGGLGIAALLRTQSLLLMPVILIIAVWYYHRAWKDLVKVSGLFLLGLVLVISPWLIRNWEKTGSLVFDDPATQTALLAQRYSAEMGEMPAQQTGETQVEYSHRISKDIRKFIRANPLLVASFVSTHTLNNLVSTVLILPMRFQLDQRCDTTILCDPFWISITDHFTIQDGFLLFINLMIVSFGIASSWRRWKVAGLVPLIFLSGYSLSNGLARNSARRYILPVDWVGYLYLMIGLFEFAMWAAILFGASKSLLQSYLTETTRESPSKPAATAIKLSISVGFFLVVGLSIPVTEIAIRPAWIAQNKTQLISAVTNSPGITLAGLTPADLKNYATHENMRAIKGKLFYPRFYPPGEGEPGSGWPAYKPYEYRVSGKLGAVLIGPDGMTQVNLTLDQAPGAFPNASDVIILGCQEDGYLDALLVYFLATEQTITRSNLERMTCPLR